MSYSNSRKRNGIICDEPIFVLNEKTYKLIHISLNKIQLFLLKILLKKFLVFIVKLKIFHKEIFPDIVLYLY